MSTRLLHFVRRSRRRHRWSLALITLLGVLLGGVVITWIAVRYVTHASGRIYRDPAAVPVLPVAIVFGAGVLPDGTLTAALVDRVVAAGALYRAGRVRHVLLTGDNSSTHYNEVAAMYRFALQQGIPAEVLTSDYAGFRTYDSCYRAQAIFGVDQAVLVTQAYHLPRALYTCKQLGLQVVGLAADALPGSRAAAYADLLPGYIRREYEATLLMLWQVHVTHPAPRFLGPVEPIRG